MVITRDLDTFLCLFVRLFVGSSLTSYFFLCFCGLWPHCSYPEALVTSNLAPAYPQVTGVSMYPALFFFGGGGGGSNEEGKDGSQFGLDNDFRNFSKKWSNCRWFIHSRVAGEWLVNLGVELFSYEWKRLSWWTGRLEEKREKRREKRETRAILGRGRATTALVRPVLSRILSHLKEECMAGE